MVRHKKHQNASRPRRGIAWWRIAAITIAVMGTIVFSGVAYTVAVTSGPAGAHPDVQDDLATLARQRSGFVESGRNGWADVIAVFALYRERFADRYSERRMAYESIHGPSSFSGAGMVEMDAAYHDAFDADVYSALVKALTADRFETRDLMFPLTSPAPLSVMQSDPSFTGAFATHIAASVNEQQWDTLLDQFTLLLRLAEAVRIQPGFQSAGQADWMISAAVLELLRTLPERGVPEETARALISRIASVPAVDPAILMAEDRVIRQAFFGSFYTAEGYERAYDRVRHEPSSRRQTVRGAFASRWVRRSREGLQTRISSIFDHATPLLQQPFPDRRVQSLSDADAERIIAQGKKNGRLDQSAEAWVENSLPTYVLDSLDWIDVAESTRAALILKLMVDVYAGRTGDLPENLVDLKDIASDFGVEIPIDQISMKPFGFERFAPGRDEADADASYRLYSIGPDQRNDGQAAAVNMHDHVNVRYVPAGADFDFYPANVARVNGVAQ